MVFLDARTQTIGDQNLFTLFSGYRVRAPLTRLARASGSHHHPARTPRAAMIPVAAAPTIPRETPAPSPATYRLGSTVLR